MGQRERKGLRSEEYRLPIRISVAVVIWVIVLELFCMVMDIRPTVFYTLKDRMTADVTYADGRQVHFEDGNFGVVNLGDRVEMHVTFPESYNIKAAELFVPLHNVIMDVFLDGRGILYQDHVNTEDLTKHYGNRIYEVQLPGGFEKHEMVWEIQPRGRLPYSDLANIGIIPANEGWKRIITGNVFVFLVSITLMVMAAVCICYFTVKSLEERKLQMGLPIAVFELVICGWFFGSLGMFYLVVEDVSFCAKIEYYTLYLAPIPLTMFIYQVIDKPVMKKLVAGVGLGYVVFYVIATALERIPGMPNYSKLLPGMHVLSGVTVICLVVAIFFGTQGGRNSYIVILRIGILVAMLFGLTEILRFNIVKYVFDDSWVSTNGLSGIAILIVAVSLVVYLISYSTNQFAVKIERQQLIKLAYQDALTGMPNRADCYRNIEEMEKKKLRDYTIVFIDLNDLKKTNDSYGHEAGDRLLKVTADAVEEVFSEGGFTSRWGGDEFVACVYGKKELALEKLESFQQKMKAANESGEYPFSVSAACGYMESTAEAYVAPIEAIRRADERMYENKRRMKSKA